MRPLEDWQVEHGTPGGEKWHYRHGEKPCEKCRNARNKRRRERHYGTAVHADFAGKPRCNCPNPNAIAAPGQEVTCQRCIRYLARAA